MAEFSTGKSLLVLATVIGCFAVLWPKIFYPMMLTAMSLTSSPSQDEERAPQHPHMNLPPRMREAMAQSRPALHDAKIIDGRPFPHPSARNAPKLQAEKSTGAMGIVMPIYTIGIIGFFLYTILKLVCRKNQPVEATEEQPSFRGYQMDPNLQRYTTIKDSTRSKQPVNKSPSPCCDQGKTRKFLEDYGRDNEDLEISHLRQKLVETEQRMEHLLEQIEVQLKPCETKCQESLLLNNSQHQTQMKDAQIEGELRKKEEQVDSAEHKFVARSNDEELTDSSLDSENYETVNQASEAKEINGDIIFEDSNSNCSNLEDEKGNELVIEDKVREEKTEEKETELRQRVRDVFEDEDFTYRNRGVTYSDILNF